LRYKNDGLHSLSNENLNNNQIKMSQSTSSANGLADKLNSFLHMNLNHTSNNSNNDKNVNVNDENNSTTNKSKTFKFSSFTNKLYGFTKKS
jgi:hypothetical protein